MLDVAIVGAGPAGIAAGRALAAAGRAILLIEARPRLGGRTLTVDVAGHPVDLGAHWLHAGSINPLVKRAPELGLHIRRAPQERHLRLGRRWASAAESQAYAAAFARADAALGRAAPSRDRAADALPPLGRWRGPVVGVTSLVAGRPLDEISAADFASSEYAENWFAPGGYGRLIAWLGRDLPARLGVNVRSIRLAADQVAIGTDAGELQARTAIVTVPPTILQSGAIRFKPGLPRRVEQAIAAFRPAIYEHVVLRWPSAPFQGADRIATLSGPRLPALGLLTRLDGTGLHYLELDARLAAAASGPRGAAHLARELLREAFGARALAGLSVLTATRWRDDPLAHGSWSTAPPGSAWARDALAEPIEGRIFFAGEATDHAQWGTVGGAWLQGERAAKEALARLR